MAQKNLEPKKSPDDELSSKLTPQQYHVLREKGTEMPFTGKYVHHKGKGMYTCAACGNVLFSSDTKFDSGTGWPSFDAPAWSESIAERPDNNLGMRRTEVVCRNCGGHLGHVFDDGPTKTGMRYCINSCALEFREKKKD